MNQRGKAREKVFEKRIEKKTIENRTLQM